MRWNGIIIEQRLDQLNEPTGRFAPQERAIPQRLDVMKTVRLCAPLQLVNEMVIELARRDPAYLPRLRCVTNDVQKNEDRVDLLAVTERLLL